MTGSLIFRWSRLLPSSPNFCWKQRRAETIETRKSYSTAIALVWHPPHEMHNDLCNWCMLLKCCPLPSLNAFYTFLLKWEHLLRRPGRVKRQRGSCEKCWKTVIDISCLLGLRATSRYIWQSNMGCTGRRVGTSPRLLGACSQNGHKGLLSHFG